MAKTKADTVKPQTPFDAFTDLLRQVLAVPKAEIDEREEAYKASRAKKKRPKAEAVAPPHETGD